MAASHAAIFCTQVGFLNVIFEGDTLKVIKDVNSPLSRSGHFMEGIKQEVLHFSSYSFVHVGRVSNEAAHVLAKTAAVSFCDDTWFDQILSCIFDIVTREQRVPRS
jgi:predicted  nucleic acid-binding Zn ribbon protein